MSGFSFGGGTAPASSFSFGAPSTSAPSTTTFGASTTPTVAAPSAPGATPSFTFGSTAPTAFSTTPSTTPSTAAPGTSATPSFAFGTAPSTTAPSTGTTPSTFNFGAAPSTAAPTSTTAASTSTASTFTFGATSSTTAPSTTAPSTTAPSTAASTSTFTFGATPSTTAPGTTAATTSTTAPSTQPSTSFSFGSSASTSTTSAPSLTSAPSATPSTPAGGTEPKKIDLTAVLKNKNLEDIINDWSGQLEDHVGTFTKQAHQVAEWDNRIIENGAKIMKIYEHVNKVQVSQKELDQTLELVFTQQQELNGMLDSLEGELDKLMSAQARQENPADVERERGYQLAEDLNRQLDQMGVTLRELIKKINATQQHVEDDNPIVQIVQILNAHLNSLQWIDQTSTALQQKIAEVDKQLKASKLDHDKLSRTRKQNFE